MTSLLHRIYDDREKFFSFKILIRCKKVGRSFGVKSSILIYLKIFDHEGIISQQCYTTMINNNSIIKKSSTR